MEIPQRLRDGVAILEPKGRITFGSGDEELRDAVRQALEGPSRNILVSMGEVSFIDSSGLGELLAARTTVKNRGGDLKLLRLPPTVQDILQITSLFTLFEIHEDEDAAVASFG